MLSHRCRRSGHSALDLATFDGLPVGTYSVRASGAQPLTLSELTTYTTPPAGHSVATYGERSTALLQSLSRPAETPERAFPNYLPRLAKTTEAYTVFSVLNPNTQAAYAVIEFRDLAGGLVVSQDITLAPGGWRRFDLRQVIGIPTGFTGSAVFYSDQLLDVLADEFYVPCALPSSGQISRVPAGDLFPGTPVQFTASASGTLPFSYAWTVDGQPAGSDSATLDHAFQAAGQHTVGVTITNACGQTTASLGVDVLVPCAQPGSGQIERVPAGDLFPGTPVQFTASASGTLPFSYAWTVDGQPAGSDSATLDHAFQAAGQHTVGVTITNACGQTTASLGVDVLEPPGPDLSTSSKTGSQSAVDAGDTLTYTLILRNTGPVAATATLTDPIPLHTVYVPGSAHASDLSPVTLVGDELHWSGQVVSGTPVTIQYAVQVQSAAIGTSIENTASLSDGRGHIATLQATAVYNPGYRLTIDEGAFFTNNPTVALRFAWNAADGITACQISNDGGFTPGSDTTAWLPVNPTNPTYPGWVLAVYGDLRLPRTVYIRFRDIGGTPFGPFQDDIILDPVLPQLDSLELVPLGGTAATFSSTSGRSVLVRVIAHDDNSGVRTVQLSNRSDFVTASSYPVTGSLTEIVWPLQPSGLVYGRVLDRAGNTSPAVSAQGEPWWYRVYLPVLQRNAQ